MLLQIFLILTVVWVFLPFSAVTAYQQHRQQCKTGSTNKLIFCTWNTISGNKKKKSAVSVKSLEIAFIPEMVPHSYFFYRNRQGLGSLWLPEDLQRSITSQTSPPGWDTALCSCSCRGSLSPCSFVRPPHFSNTAEYVGRSECAPQNCLSGKWMISCGTLFLGMHMWFQLIE